MEQYARLVSRACAGEMSLAGDDEPRHDRPRRRRRLGVDGSDHPRGRRRAETSTRRSSRSIPKPDIQAELNRLEQRKPRIDPDRLPDISKLPAGKEGAEQRFQVAQALWRGVNRDLLLLSLIAYDVSARAEFQELGFRSIRAWGDAVGIWSGTLSKMLQVAKCFQGAWIDLPADRTGGSDGRPLVFREAATRFRPVRGQGGGVARGGGDAAAVLLAGVEAGEGRDVRGDSAPVS